MKNLLILSLGIILTINAIGQRDKHFEDLVELYAQEKYEKYLKKSLKYVDDEDTKKDPRPSFHAARAYLKLHEDSKYREKYPKAYKNSVKYASKMGKLIKKAGEYHKYFVEDEDIKDFTNKLKSIIAEEVENYFLSGEDKKANDIIKKASLIDYKDYGIRILKGTMELKNKNLNEGKRIINEALDEFKKLGPEQTFPKMSESSQYMLRLSLITYAEYQEKDAHNHERAVEILEFGKKYFYGENKNYIPEYDSKYKEVYDRIVEN